MLSRKRLYNKGVYDVHFVFELYLESYLVDIYSLVPLFVLPPLDAVPCTLFVYGTSLTITHYDTYDTVPTTQLTLTP